MGGTKSRFLFQAHSSPVSSNFFKCIQIVESGYLPNSERGLCHHSALTKEISSNPLISIYSSSSLLAGYRVLHFTNFSVKCTPAIHPLFLAIIIAHLSTKHPLLFFDCSWGPIKLSAADVITFKSDSIMVLEETTQGEDKRVFSSWGRGSEFYYLPDFFPTRVFYPPLAALL